MTRAVHFDLPGLPAPMPLFCRLLKPHHRWLKDLCFMDNEYGEARAANINLIERRVIIQINRLLSRGGQSYRLISIECCRARHHHIILTWRLLGADPQPEPMLLNIYPASRRSAKVTEDGEEEDDEREGPRRGD